MRPLHKHAHQPYPLHLIHFPSLCLSFVGLCSVNLAPIAAKAYSVEHNEAWCLEMEALIEKEQVLLNVIYILSSLFFENNVSSSEFLLTISFFQLDVRYKCVPVPLGHLGWNYVFDEGTYTQFRDYVDAIDTFNIRHGSLDYVLIDGRARVSCAIKVFCFCIFFLCFYYFLQSKRQEQKNKKGGKRRERRGCS